VRRDPDRREVAASARYYPYFEQPLTERRRGWKVIEPSSRNASHDDASASRGSTDPSNSAVREISHIRPADEDE
jgi:hypothetical protein